MRLSILILLLVLCIQAQAQSMRDTTIEHNIIGISAEGTRFSVTYQDGDIATAIIHLFGETWQEENDYTFYNDYVAVDKKRYNYKGKTLTYIQDSTDIVLESTEHYTINTNTPDWKHKSRDAFLRAELQQYTDFPIDSMVSYPAMQR